MAEPGPSAEDAANGVDTHLRSLKPRAVGATLREMPPKFGGFGSAAKAAEPKAAFVWMAPGGQQASADQKDQTHPEADYNEAQDDVEDPDIAGLPGEGTPFPEAPLRGWVRPDERPPELPPQSQASTEEIATGDYVVVQNVTGNARLNGLTGVVDELLGDGRWRVVLQSDLIGEKGFKAQNLRKFIPRFKEEASNPGDSQQSSKSAPSAVKRVRRKALAGSCPPPPEGTALKAILKSARPDWKERDCALAQEKLGKVGIKTGLELLMAVKTKSKIDLNTRLKAVGEKAFAASTLQAFVNPPAADPKSSPSTASEKSVQIFPAHAFQVVHDMANVREDCSLTSISLERKTRGDVVGACLESFDGWIRLDGEPGWMMKDMKGTLGIGTLLSPMGKPKAQAYTGPSDFATQLFEVVYKHVAVRASPMRNAMMLQLKMQGEEVQASYQTYDGWIYVPELDGWMLSSDAQLGQLLRHIEPLQEDFEDGEVLDAVAFAG